MDNFVKAHVTKSKNNSAEEIRKRQFKLMLQGYKENDNEAIKTSTDKAPQLEDSFSNYYGDTFFNLTQESTISDDSHSISNSASLDTITPDEERSIKKFKGSLSEDRSRLEQGTYSDHDISMEDNSSSENGESETSSSNNLSESEDSQPFDPDGILASNILQKLTKNHKKNNIKSMKNKSKVNKQSVHDNWLVEDISHLQISKNILPQEPDEMNSSSSETEDSTTQETSSTLDSSEATKESTSINSQDSVSSNSEPFVSYEAPEFYCEGLTAILSDYKCPITRVLPCESKTVPVHSSKIFTSEIVDTGLKESASENEDYQSFDEQFDRTLEGSVIDETEVQDDIADTTETFNDEPMIESISETSNEDVLNDGNTTDQVKVYFGNDGTCVLILKHPIEIHIHGKVSVTLLSGSAEILGFSLKDKTYNVFAPYLDFAQYLRTLEKESEYYGLFGKLTSSGLNVSDAEDIVTSLNDYDVVVKLQKLCSPKIDFVEENYSTKSLFRKQNKYVDNCFMKASQTLDCSLYLNAPARQFYENPTWKNIFHAVGPQSRGIIAGGKSSGKSTFVRYSVNKLLARGPALLVDLDPGQSELAPAGGVSATLLHEPLLGPNYTHLTTPDIFLNVGLINVMDNVNRYVNAVVALIEHCAGEERYQNVPWVVNTMGLCNSLGLKIMTLVILLLRPNYVVQMDSKNAGKRFEYNLNPHIVRRLYLEQYQKNIWFRTVNSDELDYAYFVSEPRNDGKAQAAPSLPQRDNRYLSFLAYFGELLEQRKTDNFLKIPPYKAPLERFRIASNVKFDENAITKVINGKIVALCEDAFKDNARKLCILADKPLRCYGYGLVRGIDEETGHVYVASPAARQALAGSRLLLHGAWAPELRAEAGLPRGAALPYRAASSLSHKQLMHTPRRRFNPMQLLKMSRSN